MIKRRARLKTAEEMPDWVKHCPEFFQACMDAGPSIENYEDGSFDIDISELQINDRKCAICGFLLPRLRGYKIVSEKKQGYVVSVEMIDIAEGEVDESIQCKNSSDSTR